MTLNNKTIEKRGNKLTVGNQIIEEAEASCKLDGETRSFDDSKSSKKIFLEEENYFNGFWIRNPNRIELTPELENKVRLSIIEELESKEYDGCLTIGNLQFVNKNVHNIFQKLKEEIL